MCRLGSGLPASLVGGCARYRGFVVYLGILIRTSVRFPLFLCQHLAVSVYIKSVLFCFLSLKLNAILWYL